MKKLLSIVLACAMICSIFVMPVSVSAAVGDRVNFPIGVATGANSKLFIQYYSNSNDDNVYKNEIPADGEWVPGLDYNTAIAKTGSYYYPTGVFATDNANLYGTNRTGAFLYELDESKDNTVRTTNFVTKGDKIVWTVEGVDYYVNPYDKAIQLMTSVKLDNLTVSELEDDFASLAGVTLDVPDGNYSSIGFLVSSPTKYKLKVTPVYADGAGAEQQSEDFTNDTSASNPFRVYSSNFKTVANATNGRWGDTTTIYEPKTFAINPEKELVSVIVKSAGAVYPMTIISAWGIDASEGEDEPAEIFEVTEATVESGSVKVAYTNTTAADKAVKVIVAEYDDAEESSLANVHIIDATLAVGGAEFTQAVATTKSTVKVFVWKDLTDFFPYK